MVKTAKRENNSLQAIKEGDTINSWSYIEYKGVKNGLKKGLFQCKCGLEKELVIWNVLKERTKSCKKCSHDRNKNDTRYINKKFDSLKIKKVIRNGHETNPIAICDCDCGRSDIKKPLYGIIKKNNIKKSCGCLNRKSLKNKKFGKLLVINEVESESRVYNGKNMVLRKWKCICDCGNHKEVFHKYLTIGDVKSCGCLNSSEELSKRTTGAKNPMYGIKGSLHPSWDPERTSEEIKKKRNTWKTYVWRMSVLERDRFTCKCCGAIGNGSNLNVHHIYNYKDFSLLRYSTENGITLCKQCHVSFHQVYGKTKNNKEQIEDFISSIKKKTFSLKDVLSSDTPNINIDYKPYEVTTKVDGELVNVEKYYKMDDICMYRSLSKSTVFNIVNENRATIIKHISAKLPNGQKMLFKSYSEAGRFFNCKGSTIKKIIDSECVSKNRLKDCRVFDAVLKIKSIDIHITRNFEDKYIS